MLKKGLVLRFPPEIVDQPIVYRLARDFNLVFNILKAMITPGKEGIMILELSGDMENLEKGLKFLTDVGVEVKPIAQQVQRMKKYASIAGLALPSAQQEPFL